MSDTSPSTDFSSIPILDYLLLSTNRVEFLRQLRHALINVGFLYLRNPPVDVSAVIQEVPRFFALPQEAKDRLSMRNSPHFLGYTRLGTEYTKGAQDMREQIDLATPHENRWTEGDPDFVKLWGSSQWPADAELPKFREVVEGFLTGTDNLAFEFTGLLAEALGLDSGELTKLFEPRDSMQHRGKLVKYPEVQEGGNIQGVGPHYDTGFLTFLVQASEHRGLQVQNFAGDWIDVPPIPNTFVVNMGRGLEALTSGVALATSHRVISPPAGSGTRYSIPFFQMIAQRILVPEAAERLKFLPDVLAERDARGARSVVDAVNHSAYGSLPAGEVALIGRVKSHPDVAQIHYPQLFSELFPNGLPQQAAAY